MKQCLQKCDREKEDVPGGHMITGAMEGEDNGNAPRVLRN